MTSSIPRILATPSLPLTKASLASSAVSPKDRLTDPFSGTSRKVSITPLESALTDKLRRVSGFVPARTAGRLANPERNNERSGFFSPLVYPEPRRATRHSPLSLSESGLTDRHSVLAEIDRSCLFVSPLESALTERFSYNHLYFQHIQKSTRGWGCYVNHRTRLAPSAAPESNWPLASFAIPSR